MALIQPDQTIIYKSVGTLDISLDLYLVGSIEVTVDISNNFNGDQLSAFIMQMIFFSLCPPPRSRPQKGEKIPHWYARGGISVQCTKIALFPSEVVDPQELRDLPEQALGGHHMMQQGGPLHTGSPFPS